ncbi:MAG: helix-turn-helix domain-containing protein [Methylophilus sp.]
MENIGERLRIERERLKLNQTQFGEAGGVKKNAQIKYEKGERSPDASYLELLSSIGVDVLFVITGQRNENTATTAIELSYLRICRALPDNNARMAGNAALVGVLSAYSSQLSAVQVSNDYARRELQKGDENDKVK